MSYLIWKKGTDGRRRLFIITNPVTIILTAIVFMMLFLPLAAFLRSLLQ